MEENKQEPINNGGATEPTSPSVEPSDPQIEVNALKELLAENKKTMDALKNELTSVKTTNAKLMNQLSVEPQKPSVEEMLNNSFNKYNKKGK